MPLFFLYILCCFFNPKTHVNSINQTISNMSYEDVAYLSCVTVKLSLSLIGWLETPSQPINDKGE